MGIVEPLSELDDRKSMLIIIGGGSRGIIDGDSGSIICQRCKKYYNSGSRGSGSGGIMVAAAEVVSASQ